MPLGQLGPEIVSELSSRRRDGHTFGIREYGQEPHDEQGRESALACSYTGHDAEAELLRESAKLFGMSGVRIAVHFKLRPN